jgi:hypothetical protein
MNVFIADHPLVRDSSPALLRLQRRLLRGFLAVLMGCTLVEQSPGPDVVKLLTVNFDGKLIDVR